MVRRDLEGGGTRGRRSSSSGGDPCHSDSCWVWCWRRGCRNRGSQDDVCSLEHGNGGWGGGRAANGRGSRAHCGADDSSGGSGCRSGGRSGGRHHQGRHRSRRGRILQRKRKVKSSTTLPSSLVLHERTCSNMQSHIHT